MNEEWYVAQEGRAPVGPVPTVLIASAIQSGEIKADAKVSTTGEPPWRKISSVAAFAPLFPATTTAASDDPFSDLQARTPEDELRTAIRAALADGVVTADEKSELETLQKKFGMTADAVRRIVQEERTRAGTPAAPLRTSPEPTETAVAAPDPRHRDTASSRSVATAKPAWLAPAVLAGIAAVLLLGWYLMAGKKDAPATPIAICQALVAEGITKSCKVPMEKPKEFLESVSFGLEFAGKELALIEVIKFPKREDAERNEWLRDEYVRLTNARMKEEFSFLGDKVALGSHKIYKSRSGTLIASINYGTDTELSKVEDKLDRVRSLVRAAP